ncbi:MAG: biotin--[acetyl-CoA-carboxylase] ligase [Candidatus Eisenbacteria bacterium]|nr:biotin--[acetyl-CoA-carboxylase] ligase [Candidatus Eisenbacteria bacterium]
MADPTFDRARFSERLATRRLGRQLVVRAEVESTNDTAWDALAAGAADGTAVVADAQTRGRGRAGRAWHTAPGRGLALSVLLHQGCDRRQLGVLPLAAGLALARGLEELGVRAALKWPNDLLLGGRKLAGVLCESRRLPSSAGGAGQAAVIGVGVNVTQRAEDFPADLASSAISLALAGHAAGREEVAAGFLNALEPLWDELQEGARTRLLEAWSARAAFWGTPLTVRTPAGPLTGTARRLDDDGALVLALETGVERAVLAGDVEPAGAPEGR